MEEKEVNKNQGEHLNENLKRKRSAILTVSIGMSILLLIGVIIFIVFYFKRSNTNSNEISSTNGTEELLSDIETIDYVTEIPFDPDKLEDITDTSAGDEVISNLNENKTYTEIPANSKITLEFETYCIDALGDSYYYYESLPTTLPTIFSYEAVDMPMYSDIIRETQSNFEVSQEDFQDIIWGLSRQERKKFEDFYEEEQAILLSINPDAQYIIDNYEYFQNINIKKFNYPENTPEEALIQPIYGTELYAIMVSNLRYFQTDLEIYNPTNESQTFYLMNDAGEFFTYNPIGYEMNIPLELLDTSEVEGFENNKNDIIGKVFAIESIESMAVVAGEFSIENKKIVTNSNQEVVLRINDEYLFHVGKNSIMGKQDFLKPASNKGWLDSTFDGWIDKINRLRPPNKFQREVPTCIVAVRG